MTPETPVETTIETVSAANSAPERANSAILAPRLRETPSFHHHLPRFHRAKGSHRPPLALQSRDLELLQTAHDYRLIMTPQYLRLFSDESRVGIYRRLQKLFHHGYLDRIGENPNAPLVYALGKRGAEVLEVPHRKNVGDRYLAHQLMIGDFRIAVALAARESAIEVSWRRVPDGQPIRPDGFFGLRFPTLPEGRNCTFFFLEADRSTMPRERFLAKLHAYQAWHAAGGHTAALGIKSFRVLTVTKSVERMRGLLTAAAEDGHLAPRHAAYWFASDSAGEGALGALGPIWHTAAEPDGLANLLPAGI